MNIGDSKAMHYKLFSDETIFPEIDPLSFDHKPENPVEKKRIEKQKQLEEQKKKEMEILKS